MKLFTFIILILSLGFSASIFAQSKPFQPQKEMKQIIPLYATMEVEVGQKLYYSANEHASVGTQSNAWSENDSIINLFDTYFAYDNQNNAQTKGGDAATQTYIFEALQTGKCTIIMEERFRDELKNKYSVEVIVKEKKELTNNKIEQPKTKLDTVILIPFKNKETVQLGQILIYKANVHGSVGKGALF